MVAHHCESDPETWILVHNWLNMTPKPPNLTMILQLKFQGNKNDLSHICKLIGCADLDSCLYLCHYQSMVAHHCAHVFVT